MKRILIGMTVAGALAAGAIDRGIAAAQPGSCESLATLKLPNATITLAAGIAPKGLTRPAVGTAPSQRAFSNPIGMCRVNATLRPSPDSEIKMELWMPATGWNGKFQAVGNGGWGGLIGYPAMAEALGQRYATASTDTGHTGDSGAFAPGHPEKLVDFAYRSVHETTVTAKAIISAFYGRAAKFSYWNGCSTGGRQGLTEAQRFPGDFDGIIAGAAASPRPFLHAWQLSVAQAILKNDASVIPPAKYAVIHEAVLAACDAADGVKDRLISDPPRCHFDPKVIQCTGADGPSCLTSAQVQSVRIAMSPATSPKTGAKVFFGYEPGSELMWTAVMNGQPARYALEGFRDVVYNDPNWDWRTFDLDRDLAKANEVDKGMTSAVDPDLTKFAGRGGKLLMYHGWSDGAIPPGASVSYYTSVVKRMGGAAKTDRWVRLFMAPGMGHCGLGDGPNTFDLVTPLDEWVTHGKAPDRIIAARIADGKTERTRPLCPYPQVAAYKGTGSTDDAVNFICRTR